MVYEARILVGIVNSMNMNISKLPPQITPFSIFDLPGTKFRSHYYLAKYPKPFTMQGLLNYYGFSDTLGLYREIAEQVAEVHWTYLGGPSELVCQRGMKGNRLLRNLIIDLEVASGLAFLDLVRVVGVENGMPPYDSELACLWREMTDTA